MLQRLSDNIRECYLRADECRRHADETVDPARSQFYLDMERRWLASTRCPASRPGLAAASCRRRSAMNENAPEIGTATNTSTHSPVTISSTTNNVRAIDCRQLMTKSPEDCPAKQHHYRGLAAPPELHNAQGAQKNRPAMNRGRSRDLGYLAPF